MPCCVFTLSIPKIEANMNPSQLGADPEAQSCIPFFWGVGTRSWIASVKCSELQSGQAQGVYSTENVIEIPKLIQSKVCASGIICTILRKHL